jgi:hypothetical protein
VVDGDTIDVSDGSTVRLIGIDTPERGQCGYAEARDHLARLVGGKVVTLVPGAREDADRYRRLLRYVQVDGLDVDLEMIRSGRAVARYDSRDGYGRHPREDDYIAVDAATPSANVCGAPAPPPPLPPVTQPSSPVTVPPGPRGGLDPRFRTCREAIAHGYGPYRKGVDPEYPWYRDGDGDGINCE